MQELGVVMAELDMTMELTTTLGIRNIVLAGLAQAVSLADEFKNWEWTGLECSIHRNSEKAKTGQWIMLGRALASAGMCDICI